MITYSTAFDKPVGGTGWINWYHANRVWVVKANQIRAGVNLFYLPTLKSQVFLFNDTIPTWQYFNCPCQYSGISHLMVSGKLIKDNITITDIFSYISISYIWECWLFTGSYLHCIFADHFTGYLVCHVKKIPWLFHDFFPWLSEDFPGPNHDNIKTFCEKICLFVVF